MRILKINTEYIQLVQLLKLADVISSGGEIKFLIEEGLIFYNGEPETRVRKKIYPGDVVEVDGEQLGVSFARD